MQLLNLFKRKPPTIPTPSLGVADQLAMAIKSLSLPQAAPAWSLYAKSNPGWDTETAIREGYNASAIVYACVEKRAKLLASAPWKVMRRKGGKWEEAPETHPLARLIESPNPDQSWYELIYGASQSLDLSGNAYISEIKAGVRNLPTELWLLPAKNVRIKPSRTRLIDQYEYTDGYVTNQHIDAADMTHLRFPNPDSPYFGMPTLMAAGRATDIDREAGVWQKCSLQNGGVPVVHIKVPETVQKEDRDHIRQQYSENQSGSLNAKRPIVSSADIQALGQTAVELDFTASRRAVWTEICAVFGMSLSNLGMTEDVNLANAEAMDKALWQNTTIPTLELLERQLTHQLAKEFGDDVKLVADLTNVEALQTSLDDKLAAAERMQRLGVPMNEINQKLELGFEDRSEWGVSYIPQGLIPAGFDVEPLNGDPEADGKEAFGE